MRDIEKDFQSSNEHSRSMSPARSLKSSKLDETDDNEKAVQTEQVMSFAVSGIMLSRVYQQSMSNSTSGKG